MCELTRCLSSKQTHEHKRSKRSTNGAEMSEHMNDTDGSKLSESTSQTGSAFDELEALNARMSEDMRQQIKRIADMTDQLQRQNDLLDWMCVQAHEAGWTYRRISDATALTSNDVATRIARSRRA